MPSFCASCLELNGTSIYYQYMQIYLRDRRNLQNHSNLLLPMTSTQFARYPWLNTFLPVSVNTSISLFCALPDFLALFQLWNCEFSMVVRLRSTSHMWDIVKVPIMSVMIPELVQNKYICTECNASNQCLRLTRWLLLVLRYQMSPIGSMRQPYSISAWSILTNPWNSTKAANEEANVNEPKSDT